MASVSGLLIPIEAMVAEKAEAGKAGALPGGAGIDF